LWQRPWPSPCVSTCPRSASEERVWLQAQKTPMPTAAERPRTPRNLYPASACRPLSEPALHHGHLAASRDAALSGIPSPTDLQRRPWLLLAYPQVKGVFANKGYEGLF